MSLPLETPVQYLKGVGPRRAAMMSKAGLFTAQDLLYYRPFRYEDRTAFRPLRSLRPGEVAVVRGRIHASQLRTTPRKRMRLLELTLGDETGYLHATFFNQPYLSRILQENRTVILFGEVRSDGFTGRPALVNPEFELIDEEDDLLIHTGRIVPIYRKLDQLTPRQFRIIIFKLLEQLSPALEDPLPHEVRRRLNFPGRYEALRELHFPVPPPQRRMQSFLKDLQIQHTAAQQRMIFEEFFSFQLGLEAVRLSRTTSTKPWSIQISQQLREVIKAVLPFRPTAAQKRVLKEIVDDLRSPNVMNRLLQGDVGSGKTIVALQAMLVVIENGLQAALMAPTEILAEQHCHTISRLLAKTRYRIALLTGRTRAKERKQLLPKIKSGEIDLVIGTHAVIQEQVEFGRLAFVIIDEQHRFGVLQRFRLMEKGPKPDTLVMTATPIPRSLALTLYGDLSVSLLDEFPPGRKPVKTVVKLEESRRQVYDVIGRELKMGRQVYVVYPLIKESSRVELRAATQMADHLQREVFPEYPVGLMHGRLKSSEKEDLMGKFASGEVQVLVSTTVIEVGIDVPNATVMLIEHADRFGLAQLHQLRGRVGRGIHPGLCILMISSPGSKESLQRLDVMRRTNDGFEIAEKDLEIRGPGEFIGTRQSGMPGFVFGHILRDRKLLELARSEARRYLQNLVESDPTSRASRLHELIERWRERFQLLGVG